MSLNAARISAAFQALADAFAEDQPEPTTAGATEPTQKRGRGRPVKGETAPATAVQAAPAVVEDDPFAAPAPAAPTATIEEVRAALTALKTATSQDNALKVLKDASGADNLPSLAAAKYGEVVMACNKAMPAAPAAVVEDDPFAAPAAAAPAEKPPTLEDVKAAVVDAQKRTSPASAQKVVMDLGGKAKNAETGIEGASLKALPEANYAAAIAGLKALPTTK